MEVYDLEPKQQSLLQQFKLLGVNGGQRFHPLLEDIDECFDLRRGEAKAKLNRVRLPTINITFQKWFRDHAETRMSSRFKNISAPGENHIYQKTTLDDITVADIREVQKWADKEIAAVQAFCGPLTHLAEIIKCSPELAATILELVQNMSIRVPGSSDEMERSASREIPVNPCASVTSAPALQRQTQNSATEDGK